jgi:hypothetical protein
MKLAPRQAVVPEVDERCPSPGRRVLQLEGLTKSFSRGLPPRRRRIEVLKGASLMVCRYAALLPGYGPTRLSSTAHTRASSTPAASS